MLARIDENVDLRVLARLGLWGSAAILSLLLAVLAFRSETGTRRIGMAGSATPAELAQTAVADRNRQLEDDSKRLIEAVRTLSSDRDRLLARVTVLERNLEDVTGSVSKIGTARERATSSWQDLAQLMSGPSVISSISAPQTITAFPAPRAAALQPAARPSAAPESTGTVTEFGVDIGGGPSIQALRELWNAAKGAHQGAFDGLRPVIGVRDVKPDIAELRLIVGPLANANAAARLCAQLSTTGWTCRQSVFDGQRLAIR